MINIVKEMLLKPNVTTFHIYLILFFILRLLIDLLKPPSQNLSAFRIKRKSAAESASRFLWK